MDEAARAELLEIAREAVSAAVRGRKPAKTEPRSAELREPRGAFVTVKTRGRLRGCIGQFEATRPLVEIVREMAVAAVARDPRFTWDRLTERELPDVEIDVSVLGPLETIDDPLDFELGVHGIYLRRGFATGCFLPQVATETGWTKEEFLSHCAAGKAGLDPEAWKDPATQVMRFTCEVVSD